MNYFKTIYNPVNKAQYDKFVNENADAINVLNNLCTDAISRLFRNGK